MLNSVLLNLLLLAFTLAASAADVPNTVLRLDRADFVGSDATEPPADAAAWQPVSLPDDWHDTHSGLHGYGWYRLRFELTPPVPGKPAVYLPLLRNVGAIYLNGALVGSTGVFGRADNNLVGAPVLLAIEPRKLHAGGNTLHIRLWSPQGRSEALGPVSIGERPVLDAEVERERFVQITLPQMAGAFSATVGLYMLVLWLRRRHDEVYGYFAAAALTHAVYVSTHVQIGGWQLPPGGGVFCAAFWHASWAFLFIFCLRFAGLRSPRVERGAWLYTLLMWTLFFGVAFFPDQRWRALAYSLWSWLLLAIPVASLIVLLRTLWQRRSNEALLLALGALYSVAVLTMGSLNLSPGGLEMGDTHLIPLLVIMGWILMRRFVRSLNETEALNTGLEQRVAERHAELEREQARLQALTRQQAISEERERIMTDMHDGLGAQLITALGRVEHGDTTSKQVAAALRACIDDLRLAIDSLEPRDGDLLSVLGNLRYRLEGRLKASGIALDWQVGEVPKLVDLTPRNVLHVLRILQEAFTNVLEHARATRIRVSTAVDAQRVKIDVSDDGRGFAVDEAERDAGAAHGLAKMRGRAKALGGELLVMPTPNGTTLSLLMPRG